MRELHVVALSSDGKHLIVTPTKGSLRGAYLLPVNARLRKALNGELNPKPKPAKPAEPAEPAEAPKPAPATESRLSPREIQARLRAGHTPERIARAAGVPVDRVTRFQGPVLSERALVLDAARGATLSRARRGDSAAPLGASVTANLSAKGITAEPEDWTALRRADGAWVVGLTVTGRGKPRRAEWCWVPATKSLTALDTFAAGLGHVDKPVKPPRKPAKRAAAKPATSTAANAANTTTAKPATSAAVKPVKSTATRPATSPAAKPAKATAAKPAKATAAKPARATAAKPAKSTAAKPTPATSTAAKPQPAKSTAAKPKAAKSAASKNAR